MKTRTHKAIQKSALGGIWILFMSLLAYGFTIEILRDVALQNALLTFGIIFLADSLIEVAWDLVERRNKRRKK